jgi:hydrogenase maturation protein HypF
VSERVRAAVRVEGTVQGVGFRPFVYSLATRLDLGGLVGNDAGGVFAEVEGTPAAISEFLAALERDAPPLAIIEKISTTSIPPNGAVSFSIVASESAGARRAAVPADSATCGDCLRELRDPRDRRFGYPFINCTNCGPRFTIIRDVPYDRPQTTMAGFEMCTRCAAEYHDPADRRFHAQPVCCPDCGPTLRLQAPTHPADLHPALGGDPDPAFSGRSDPALGDGPRPALGGGSNPAPGPAPGGSGLAGGGVIGGAVAVLRGGGVLAVKGLGGYHLAVDAANEEAAAALRARKHREDKPFALMVADLAAARRLCEVDEAAADLLTGQARPIVLLPRRPDAHVAAAVAPGNRELGIMLPYTPLHHLLLDEFAGPMVLTSGNVSDEPIAFTDEDALARLAGIADAFLTHDRPIHVRTDDSVVRPFRGRAMPVRRSRGFVPQPIPVAATFRRPVLACGAELKNTFCLAKDDKAVVSHHVGDLENFQTLTSFTQGIEHFRRLFDIDPQVVAYDLHPEYLSTKYALGLDAELCGVQHHHAHIASCLADNGAEGPVIGVAFDGTGYGTDGTIWGGEFLLADLAEFQRAGHLAPVPMPGGAAAIRQPWRMAASYLDAAFPGEGATPLGVAAPGAAVSGTPGRPGGGGAGGGRGGAGLGVAQRNAAQWDNVVKLGRSGVNSPLTSSAGRLFDAVAALLGVRDAVNYEGQAAIELEQLAAPWAEGGYQAEVEDGDPFSIKGSDLVAAAAGDLAAGEDVAVIAARFHRGVAGAVERGCLLLRERHGLGTVALSGGVFQNLLLLRDCVGRLESRGFTVLVHSRVPCNDGGISLGQAVVAAARDRA